MNTTPHHTLSHLTRRLAVGLTAFALAGCSSEPATGTVVGTVTLDGKPVAAGLVSVLPAVGGTPVMATIGPDGRYRAEDVPAGDVLVAVISPPSEEVDGAILKKQPNAKGPPPAPPKPKVQYPLKYADAGTSGLKTTVKPQAEVTFDIPMKK